MEWYSNTRMSSFYPKTFKWLVRSIGLWVFQNCRKLSFRVEWTGEKNGLQMITFLTERTKTEGNMVGENRIVSNFDAVHRQSCKGFEKTVRYKRAVTCTIDKHHTNNRRCLYEKYFRYWKMAAVKTFSVVFWKHKKLRKCPLNFPIYQKWTRYLGHPVYLFNLLI